MSTTSTDMVPLVTTLQGESGFDATRILGVRLMRVKQAYPYSPVLYEPYICILAQGQKVDFLGSETHRCDAERYPVMSVPLPFEYETHVSTTELLLGASVNVEIGTSKELLLQMEEAPGGDDDNELAPSAPTASVPLDAGMADAMMCLLRCLQSPLDSRILGPQPVREIIFRALRSERGNALRAVTGRHSDYGRMARALRRTHIGYASALGIGTLAREANMSVPTSHHNFKVTTFTLPLQYLRSVRLYKAWSLMAQDGPNASTAANQVGCEGPLQFSREFKRYFGRTPNEEAQAARCQPAGPGAFAIHTDVRIFGFPYIQEGPATSSPVEAFKCLADETRVRAILLIVDQGELCVYELICALADGQPKTSRHLAQLRGAGLLLDRRQGQWVYYRLNPALSAQIHEVL